MRAGVSEVVEDLRAAATATPALERAEINCELFPSF